MANDVKFTINVSSDQAIASIKAFEKQVDKTAGAVEKDTTKMAKTSKKSFIDVSQAISTGIGMIGAKVVTSALAGVGRAVSSAVDGFIEFEQAIREINTILPNNTKLTKEQEKALTDLAGQYGTSTTEQAKAFYQTISAGITDATDAQELLTQANILAQGGLASLGSSIDVLTDVINVYGKENITAEQAADSLFTAVRLGKTTISALGSSIGPVLPLAKELGVSFDEVTASVAALTTKGGTTSERVTQLNAVFTALLKGAERGPKILGDNADAFTVTALKAKGLSKFLEDLTDATGGSTEKLQALLGRTEAVKGVLGLASDGFVTLNKNLDAMTLKSGAAASASEEVSKSLGKQVEIMNAQWAVLLENIVGSFAPAAVEGLTKVNEAFQDDTKAVELLIDSLDFLTKAALLTFPPLAAGFAAASKLIEANIDDTESLEEEYQSLIKTMNQMREWEGQEPTKLGDLLGLDENLKNNIASVSAQLEEVRDKLTEAGAEQFELGSFVLNKDYETSIDAMIKDVTAKFGESTIPIIVRAAPEGEDQAGGGEDPRIARERQVQEVLAEIDAEFAETRKLANEERLLLQGEVDTGRTEESLLKLQGIENQKKDILIKSEIEKAKAIEDATKRKDALKKAYTKQELIDQQTATKHSLQLSKFQKTEEVRLEADTVKEKDAIKKEEMNLQRGYMVAGNKLLGIALASSKRGSKAHKALAVTDATINTYAASARAYKDYPYPANIAVMAATIAGGMMQVSKISSTGNYQDGGIIPGQSFTGDNLTANVNSGEMIINKEQQTELLNIAGGGGGNNAELVTAIRALAERPVIVEVDNREIARAVQSAQQEGMVI